MAKGTTATSTATMKGGSAKGSGGKGSAKGMPPGGKTPKKPKKQMT